MSDKTTRLSQNFMNAGILSIIFGIIGFCGSSFSPTRSFWAIVIGDLSVLAVPTGIILLVVYVATYKLKAGYAMIKDQGPSGVITHTSWRFGQPNDSDILSVERTTLSLPIHNELKLYTPDDGILKISVSISYCPDIESGANLLLYKQTKDLKNQIENRVKSSLNKWVRQKPLPGTLRRALAMQMEIEEFVLADVTSTPTDALVHTDSIAYRQMGYAVNDLGIRVLEVHVTDMQPLQHGTGKPDWGDGDEITFDAQAIFKQLAAHTDNLSNLRKLKNALMENYPEEMHDDIERIYDDVRMSMMETRDR